MKRLLKPLVIGLLLPAVFSCAEGAGDRSDPAGSADSAPAAGPVPTLFGFFPSPPEASIESVFAMYEVFGEHADVVLQQSEVPWADFAGGADGESQKITDLRNQMVLAEREGLGTLFVIDPLNGLNRSEFFNLPSGWSSRFDNPEVRSAFRNYALRILKEFQPEYLGLASEINTYADAHPDDFPNYLSLYREVYDAVKAESPDTRVFVTFQWEDLNNLWPQPHEPGYAPGRIKWEQIEVFEPDLDLWVISSYPYIAFESGSAVPADYYSPLPERTGKPLAVAEGGWISQDYRHLRASPRDQVDYIEAVEQQLGNRLVFWIYLLAQDIDIDSYSRFIGGNDLETLGFFTTVGLIDFDGTPKPGLAAWDRVRLKARTSAE